MRAFLGCLSVEAENSYQSRRHIWDFGLLFSPGTPASLKTSKDVREHLKDCNHRSIMCLVKDLCELDKTLTRLCNGWRKWRARNNIFACVPMQPVKRSTYNETVLTWLKDRLPTLSAAQALQAEDQASHQSISLGLNRIDALLQSGGFNRSNSSTSANGLVRGRVVEVFGPPGIGKTTLWWLISKTRDSDGDYIDW